jgi:hypothetical protein
MTDRDTDRLLLEKAAKAAGLDSLRGCYSSVDGLYLNTAQDSDTELWNPLTDDGDALRLVVKLGIHIEFGANYIIVNGDQSPTVNNSGDPAAATRRAIVRAAAALGGECAS